MAVNVLIVDDSTVMQSMIANTLLYGDTDAGRWIL